MIRTSRTDSTPQAARVGLRGDGWVEVDLPELPWVVSVIVRKVDGVPELLGLHLEPRWDDEIPARQRVISAEQLRRFPLRTVRQAAMAAVQLDFDEIARGLVTRIERTPGQPWPAEHFRQVAAVYERAVATGVPPLISIMRLWTVSRPTAAKWVRQARKLGVLGYPERPGVAGSSAKKSPITNREAP